MKIYFLSSRPCALHIGGAYFGITDRFERFANVCLADNLPIVFTPENALPICFFLTENIRFQAPDGVEVYLLNDAIALYARDFPPRDFVLRACAPARQSDLLVSVFSQGQTQVSFQSSTLFTVSPLPVEFEKSEISFIDEFVFIKAPQTLAIFTQTGERIFMETVQSFVVENGVLCATLPLHESLGVAIDGKWKLTQTACERISVSCQAQNPAQALDDTLVAYTFFESVRIGADVEYALADNLLSQKEHLLAFLGDFCAVMPTENPNTCALIRAKAERVFEARYCSVKIENGKIVDILF